MTIGLKTIYDPDGNPLTDIRARAETSSLVNDIGEAVFSVPYDDIKCKEQYLRFGNLVLFQYDDLPSWVGVIDLPRTWKRGQVEIHAYEMSLLLKYRFAPLNTTLQGTPGTKSAQLIEIANQQAPTNIQVASGIFTGGISSDSKVNSSVYSHISSFANDNGYQWAMKPVIGANGRMYIEFDFQEKIGASTQLVLAQGVNVLYGETPLDETGELINHVEAVVDLDNTTEAGVLSSEYFEETYYRKRAVRVVSDGSADTSGLLSIAQQLVFEKKNPSLSAPLGVTNVNSAFANIALGNTITYKFPTVGFDNPSVLGKTKVVRITGYRYSEFTGICELTVGEAG